jgi:SAM-dependent methyltransferase
MSAHPFDSAAQSYDAARGFPPGVGEQVARAAADWLGSGARVLEVGIGTGRIAKPLLALGMQVTGVDVSRQMMARLRQTLPPGLAPPALTQAGVAYLPFAAHRFDAVVSVHVFQLIADWPSALSEVRRALRPGGNFLNGYEWRPPDSPGARLMERWRAILKAAGQPALSAGARDFSDLKIELTRAGAVYEERVVGAWTANRTLARHLETIEHRTWSPGAGVPENAYASCLAQLRSWALEEFGALDREYSVPHRFVWQCFAWR